MRLGGSITSPGNLSQLFSIVYEVAVQVSSDQDKAMTLNRCKLKRIDSIATGIWAAQAYSDLLWVHNCYTSINMSGLRQQCLSVVSAQGKNRLERLIVKHTFNMSVIPIRASIH